jgi:photosystem II stability/assembly factor-like uncharacterized protein
MRKFSLICFSAIFLISNLIFAQDFKSLLDSTVNNLTPRNIGPANMGGRINDFAVVESNPFIIYCATASGGVWKTINNGVTWKPIFDDQVTSTIGNIDVAPTNPDVVWVGTGEANNRQSSSWGNGVYKSTDGGNNWKHMGLVETQSIARVRIDHTNPDIVYIAAIGRLWGSNEERGVYKTTNGGETWNKVLYVNEHTGCIDLAIDPENNQILYAAMYQRQRKGWGFIGSGPGSALYKTTDGGKTWKKSTNGLPKGNNGRIGIDIYRSDPKVVYTVVENKKGGTFRSDDKGETWTKMSDTNPRPMYYSKIRIDPNNDQRIWELGASMYTSYDGGKTFSTRIVQRIHGDHHAMWINPKNSNHMILGSDGGICFSYDRGLTWDFVNTIAIGQFYEVGFDFEKPYNVYGGLQDNGSWAGPSATRHSIGITNDDWYKVGGGDGFYTQVDPNDKNILYVESQNGSLRRMNLYTEETKSIRPTPENSGERYRFNWNSPVLISPHNSKTIYYGGNKLFKSTNMGDNWTASIDLTTQQDREKLPMMDMLPDTNTLSRHDGISYYGDIVSISESPIKEGLLWVGTDDGNVQISRDGGETWANLIDKFPDVPKYTYVSRVIASHFKEGRAYVTLDGHRNDDFKPYIFVTENFGKKWKLLSADLPVGTTVNVIREHFRNENLLFIGTERSAYFSIDRGKTWNMFKNLPMVPVDDIAIHPRENDLIFGTHGRSVWILDDITPLEQLSEKVLKSENYLFAIRDAERFRLFSHKGNTGHKFFIGPNPQSGALITYYLNTSLGKRDNVRITITDNEGKQVRRLQGTKNRGFNRINWNLRYAGPARQGNTQARGGRTPSGPYVVPGNFTVELSVKGNTFSTPVKVEMDPRFNISRQDLIAQRDALLKLSELSSRAGQMTRKIQNLSSQITELNNYLKKIGVRNENITHEVKSFSDKLGKLRTKVSGRNRRDTQAITRKISGLNSSIGSVTAKPTTKQLQEIDKIPAKLDELNREVDQFMDSEVAKINEILSEQNIKFLDPNKRVQGNNNQRRRFF